MALSVCAFCGKSGKAPSSVAQGRCTKSLTGVHRLIGEQVQYTCIHCGRTHWSASALTSSGNCHKSPHQRHELMG